MIKKTKANLASRPGSVIVTPELLVPTTATDHPIKKTIGFMSKDLVESAGGTPGDTLHSSFELVQRTKMESSHYIVYRTPLALRCNERMKEMGFLGETVLQHIPDEHDLNVGDLGKKFLLERTGSSIDFAIAGMRKDLTPNQIGEGIADTLGRFHTMAGIDAFSNFCAHCHPHPGNIIYERGKFGIIDYTLLKVGKVDYNDSNAVYETFAEDYRQVKEFILRNKTIFPNMTEAGQESFFKSLVRHYPCTEQVRGELLGKIMGKGLKTDM